MGNMAVEYLILFLLFTHFVADFICQSDWMAQGKSKEFLPLLAHTATYTAVSYAIMTLSLFWIPFVQKELILYCALNGVIHFCVDFVTSRINRRLWEAKKVHWFFVGIGADQFIHSLTLVLTLKLFV